MILLQLIVLVCFVIFIDNISTNDSLICSAADLCEYSNDSKQLSFCSCDSKAVGTGELKICYYMIPIKQNCSSECTPVYLDTIYEELCCFRNCEPDPWQSWSDCQGPCGNRTGIRQRFRKLDLNKIDQCGGTPCPSLNETESCRTKCCKVDCIWTEWSVWSACNNTCGDGVLKRNRTYLYEDECDGIKCTGDSEEFQICSQFQNVDCIIDSWSSWSTCVLDNGICGNGSENRTRSIIKNSNCNGTPCPETTEIRLCYGSCCIQNCNITEWTEWSFCNVSCGHGNQTRSRRIIVPDSCGGFPCPENLIETIACSKLVTRNCTSSTWSKWSNCSNTCGFGYQNATRYLTEDEACGGTCKLALYKSQVCKSYTDKTNCQVSKWSKWSACIKNCDGGIKIRTRNITVFPKCSGKECPVLQENTTCVQLCSQRCSSGICSCDAGYVLQQDNITCVTVNCNSWPNTTYNVRGLKLRVDYEYVSFSCNYDSISVGDTCKVKCSNSSWILRGEIGNYTCQANGNFNYLKIFCGPPNYPPKDIRIDNTKIEEEHSDNRCFGILSTIDPNGILDSFVYILTNNFENRLKIKQNLLCLNYTPNYEAPNNTWLVQIKTIDSGGLSFSKWINISLIDINDPPNGCKFDRINQMPENTGYPYFVGYIIFSDEDKNFHQLVPTLVDSDFNNFQLIFNSNQSTFKYGIQVRKNESLHCLQLGGKFCSLNYELEKFHTINIKVEDSGSPPAIVYFNLQIRLSDINDAPTLVTLNNTEISEKMDGGDVIGVLGIEDEDNQTQTYQYSMVHGRGDLFKIINNTYLILIHHIDYEDFSVKRLDIDVLGVDSGNPSKNVTTTITLILKNTNEAPKIFLVSNAELNSNKYYLNINENNNIGYKIATVLVNDPDWFAKIHYNVSGTHNLIELQDKGCNTNNLKIRNTNCQADIIAKVSFSFNAMSMIPFNITLIDDGNLTNTYQFVLIVNDVNKAPTNIRFLLTGNNTIFKDEKIKGIIVSVLIADDQDVRNQHTFKIIEDESRCFEIINRTVLKVKDNQFLDYEGKTRLSRILVEVTDDGTPPRSSDAYLTVIANDINEVPYNIYLTNEIEGKPMQSLMGNISSQGEAIGFIIVKDPDYNEFLNVICLTTFFACGNTSCWNQNFMGTVCQAQIGMEINADFNSRTNLDFFFNISVNDKGNLTFSSVFEMDIIDKSKNSSVIMFNNSRKNNIYIEENLYQLYLGKFTVDPISNQNEYFQILLDDSGYFIVENANELWLKNSSVVNYEECNLYTFVIGIFDNDKLLLNKTFNLHILNINEPPKYLFISISKVKEDILPQTTIGVLSVSDPDNQISINHTYEYQLLTYNTTFYIMDSTLKLMDGKKLDFETESLYVLEIQVIDDGQPPLSSLFNITLFVENVNEKPKNLTLNENKILENVNMGFLIGILNVQDDDPNSAITYSVDNNEKNFLISGNKLISGTIFNYEVCNVYNINITASDNGYPVMEVTQEFQIFVIDENEPPVISIQSLDGTITNTFYLKENNIPDIKVGMIIITDPDFNDSVSETIVPFDSKFKLQKEFNAYNNSTFWLIVMEQLDFEFCQKYKISINATDLYNFTTSENIAIIIEDVNEPPKNISIEGYDGTTIHIRENVKGPQFIASFTTTDSDLNDKIQYSIDACENCEDKFEFRYQTNKLFLKELRYFDYESSLDKDVKAQIRATDLSNLYITLWVKINITNALDPPIIDGLNFTQISSYLHPNDTIGSFMLTDKEIRLESYQSSCLLIEPIELFFVQQFGKFFTINAKDSKYINETVHIVLQCYYEDYSTIFSQRNISLTVSDFGNEPKTLSFNWTKHSVAENLEKIFLGQLLLKTQFSNILLKISSDNIKTERPDGIEVEIDENGNIILMSPLNYEIMKTLLLSFTLVQKDFNQTISTEIDVIDVNEAPTDIKTIETNPTVQEKSPQNVYIATIVVSDPDENQTHFCQIKETLLSKTNLSNSFITYSSVVKISNSHLTTGPDSKTMLKYSNVTTLNLTIECQDDGQPQLSKTVTILVQCQNVNDPPSEIQFINGLNLVKENITINSTLVIFIVKDEDENDNYTCSSSNHVFTILSNSIILSKSLDYEESRVYETNLTCTDNGGLNKTELWRIFVEDVDEPPEKIKVSNNKWLEQSEIGCLMANISAIDPEGSQCQFILLNCEEIICPFYLLPNGSLILNQSLVLLTDFDDVVFYVEIFDMTSQNKNFSTNITIIRETLVNISIVVKNLNPISENVIPGTEIFDLEINYLSNITHRINCQISSIGDFLYVFDLKVLLKRVLDYESSRFLEAMITCYQNQLQPVQTKAVTINITNVDEPISEIIVNFTQSVLEGSLTKQYLGNIIVNDPEHDLQAINCKANNVDAYFSHAHDCIHSASETSCEIYFDVFISGYFDFESNLNGFNFSLECNDSDSTYVKNISIIIENVNEPPKDLVVNGSLIIDLDKAFDGEIQAKLEVTDEDLNQSYNFVIQGPANKYFYINEYKELILKNIQYSWTGKLNCSFVVTDNGIPPMTATFTKEFSFIKSFGNIVLSNKIINITSKFNTKIGDIKFSSDVFQSVSFKLIMCPNDAVSILNNELWLIKDAEQLPFDKFNIKVNVINNLNNSIITSETIRLEIHGFSVCKSNITNCHPNASCESAENLNGFQCLCKLGFEGNGTSCEEINECLKNSCLGNDSICEDAMNNYVCHCEPNRSGRNCEILTKLPSINKSCVHGVNLPGEKCSCLNGWQGENCNELINNCISNACENNATCINGENGFYCNCSNYFNGIYCENDLRQCDHCKSSEFCVSLSSLSYCVKYDDIFSVSIDINIEPENMLYYETKFYTFLRNTSGFKNYTIYMNIRLTSAMKYFFNFTAIDVNGNVFDKFQSIDLIKDKCLKTEYQSKEWIICNHLFPVDATTRKMAVISVGSHVNYLLGILFQLVFQFLYK